MGKSAKKNFSSVRSGIFRSSADDFAPDGALDLFRWRFYNYTAPDGAFQRFFRLQFNPFRAGLAAISLPVFQLFRLAACVEHGQNHDASGFNQKVNHKRKTADDDCAPDFTANFWKPFWIVRNALKVFFNRGAELQAQTFAFIFLMGDGIVKLLFRNATKDEAAFHLRYFASSLALTSANETTSSGLSR